MDIIEKIKSGDETPLYELYRTHRNEFISWGVKNYSCDEDTAKDVFQDSIIVFHRNIVSGKLTELTSDVKTYLWAVGKYKLLNHLKKQSRTVTLGASQLINTKELLDLSMEESDNEQHNKELVRQHLSLLDEKSRKILELYYLQEMDMKSIAKEMGYKNSDVAKKKKYEVLKKLAKLVKGKLKMLILV